ncbi:MAG: class I SAM-dependent methyltransferase [Bacteroidetes bacterium]|nr:class I SAM-dependent methyltransferase [Bacteroidota bacterium]
MITIIMLTNFTDPYSFVEAFVYDAFIAPALTDHVDRIYTRIADIEISSAAVLDVGCGGGQNALELLKRLPAINLTGVDLSESQIVRATGRNVDFQSRSRFVQGDALDLPFDDAAFDIVFSIASIKHWPNKNRGLEECMRVLKSGGRLFILEVDRSASWSDCRNFVKKWRLPFFTLPANLIFFKGVVAANSLNLAEAEHLWEQLALDNSEVERISGLPALLMSGVKK